MSAVDTAPPATGARSAALAVPGLLLLSGAAGLGYQVVWVRMLSIGVGYEAVSMLAIVAAFFLGLALGGALFDRRVAVSARPGLWYAGLELAIGLWALVLWAAIPAADGLLADLIGPDPSALRQIVVTALGPFLLLAPATIAMGATLPAAERLHAARTGATGAVGTLYGANAVGAALGIVATTAVLAPALGYDGTLLAFAAVNVACALGAWSASASAALQVATTLSMTRPGGAALLFVTGLLGVGLEVAVVRGLAQTLEGTVYSFAVIVALYLCGAAAGAAIWQRIPTRTGTAPLLLGLTLAAAAAALLLPVTHGIYAALRPVLGGLAAETATAALVFLPSAILMGILFSRLAQGQRRPDGGLGMALAANLLGGAAAPALIGVLLVPRVGAVGATFAIAAGYALCVLFGGPARTSMRLSGLAAAAAALAFAVRPVPLIAPHPGETIWTHRDGIASSATVLSDEVTGARRLVVDGRFAMGGDATEAVDRLQGHLPLLMHPDPKSALFLGLGAGATFAAAAAHPGLSAEAVDLSQPVIDVFPGFVGPSRDVQTSHLVLRTGDARRVVRTENRHFDVIVADTFHPARDGAAFLYTEDHFSYVARRLAPGGIFAQWLPLHQFDLPTLRLVVRAFLDAFPNAQLHMANASLTTPLLMLVGGDGLAPRPVHDLLSRVGDRALGAEIARLGLSGPFDVMGGYIAGPEALAALAGDAPLSTDLHPHVLFSAPETVYSGLGPAADRLLDLVDDGPPDPRDVVALGPGAADAAFAQRLTAYWAARNAFLRLGSAAEITGDPRRDVTRLAPELLKIVAASPDYLPAVTPLVSLAAALAPRDPDAARQVLTALRRLTPRQGNRIDAALASLPAPSMRRGPTP